MLHGDIPLHAEHHDRPVDYCFLLKKSEVRNEKLETPGEDRGADRIDYEPKEVKGVSTSMWKEKHRERRRDGE